MADYTYLDEPRYRAADVLDWLRYLNRNLLQFWASNKNLIVPRKRGSSRASGDDGEGVRMYSARQLKLLSTLNECYKIGFSAEHAEKVVNSPALLTNRDVNQLGDLLAKVLARALRGDRKGFLADVSAELRSLLGCKRVSILGREDSFAKDTDFTVETTSDGFEGDRRRLLKQMASDWNRRGRLVNLSGDELNTDPVFPSPDPNPGKIAPRYERCSLLACSVSSRRRVRYWIVAEDKYGDLGMPNPAAAFDAGDESIIQAISHLIEGCHDILASYELSHAVWESIENREGLATVMASALRHFILTTDAFRGDAVFWDVTRKNLVHLCSVGYRAPLMPGQQVPNRSAARLAFESGTPRLVTESNGGDLLDRAGEARSAAAIPIRNPNSAQPLGVLTVESRDPAGFLDEEIRLIEAQLAIASLQAYIAGSQDEVWSLLMLEGTSSESPVSALNQVLEDARRELGYAKGLVFLANLRNARLEVRARMPPENDGRNFAWYLLTERALATRVFLTQTAYYSADPKNDLYVEMRGVESFGIKGPIIGVPLRMGTTTIGVIALWDRKDWGVDPSKVNAADLAEELGPFSELYVASRYSRQHELALRILANVATEKETDAAAFLGRLADALMEAGFESARIFRKLSESDEGFDRFESVVTIPTAPTPISVSAKDCEHVRFAAERHIVAEARIIDPRRDHPDPNAGKLGKPLDLPWANVPIWQGGEVIGYIAGDNRRTRRPISQAQLRFLELVAALARPAIKGSSNK